MPDEFFAEGLRFQCQPDCGACCSQKGDVFVTRDEIRRLAELMGLSSSKFRKQYAVRDHGVYKLRERFDGGCIFLSEDLKCKVYDARPQQCRTYPFWPELVHDEKAWEWEAIKCPGIGKGDLIPASEIRRMRDET